MKIRGSMSFFHLHHPVRIFIIRCSLTLPIRLAYRRSDNFGVVVVVGKLMVLNG
jgi:hypothetical protein